MELFTNGVFVIMEIKISEFSKTPLMRHCSVSECSGEEYYHNYLNQAFKNALDNRDELIVNLDGVDGYSPSFIDEVFGNLVYDFTLNKVKPVLKIISDEEPDWVNFIEKETFSQWEKRRRTGHAPVVTVHHDAWWRMNDVGEIVQQIWGEPDNG